MPGLLRQYGGLKRGARLASAGAGRQTVATAERRRGVLHASKSTTRLQHPPKAPPHSVLRLSRKLFLGMQTRRRRSLWQSARSSRGWIKNAVLCAMSSRLFAHTLRPHAPICVVVMFVYFCSPRSHGSLLSQGKAPVFPCVNAGWDGNGERARPLFYCWLGCFNAGLDGNGECARPFSPVLDPMRVGS
jgi:hypothetical protein